MKSISIVISILFLNLPLYSQMISIPGGTFLRGNADGENDEQPIRTVALTRFSMMSREVTNAQYDSCVASKKCSEPHYSDNQCVVWSKQGFKKVTIPREFRAKQYPVVCVTYDQAKQFCSWKQAELPTEAQWEYASRSGKKKQYSWGNETANSARCSMFPSTHPQEAGLFQPNEWGLHDMTGNVWEWTNDFYDPDYYNEAITENPRGPEAGFYRVIRGGGWYSQGPQLRTSNRHWFSPNFAEASVGFRCVTNR